MASSSSSSTNQAEKIKLKNKELFTDSFNICKKLLIEEDCYLNERENNSYSDLSIVHGHKMYKAMMQALNSITASNVQQDKIEVSNVQLKQAPAKKKTYNDKKNDMELDANCDQEPVNNVACHSNKNQDDSTSKHNDTTIDFIQPKKKFKPNENTLNNVNKNKEKIKTNEQVLAKKKVANDKKNHKDNNSFLNFNINWDQKQINNKMACHSKKNQENILSKNNGTILDGIHLEDKFKSNGKTVNKNQINDKKRFYDALKKAKYEASEKKWNVKIPIDLMKSVTAQNNNCIKLETGESSQDEDEIETCKNKPRHTNNIINPKKITIQSNETLKNNDHCDVDKSNEEDEGSSNKSIEMTDSKRVTRISTGLLTQIKYFDDKSRMSKNNEKNKTNGHVDDGNLLEKLDQSQNITNEIPTVEMAKKNQMKKFKNSELKDCEKQYNDGIKCSEMMKLINQWVYGKCIEHQNNGEKIAIQDIRNWGIEAKKSLMFGHLRFSASDKWFYRFKELYKLSGHSRDLQIPLMSTN